VGDGLQSKCHSHRPQGWVPTNTIKPSAEPISSLGSQVQYCAKPLSFIRRDAQVALSDSTPHTAITPR